MQLKIERDVETTKTTAGGCLALAFFCLIGLPCFTYGSLVALVLVLTTVWDSESWDAIATIAVSYGIFAILLRVVVLNWKRGNIR